MAKSEQKIERRMILMVEEVRDTDGSTHMEASWLPELFRILDEDGKDTDRIIEFAEKLMADLAEDAVENTTPFVAD